MEFQLQCTCGNRISVSDTAAGTSITCQCGQSVSVPTLGQLRRQAGLAAYEVRAARLIEHMVAEGVLPTVMNCSDCGGDADQALIAVAECEKAWTKGRNSLALVATLPFGVLTAWLASEFEGGEERGTNVIVQLPLRICPRCRRRLRHSFPWARLGAITLIIVGLIVLLSEPLWGIVLLIIAGFVALCDHFMKRNRQTQIKRVLCREPIYEQLLKEYPDARVLLSDATATVRG